MNLAIAQYHQSFVDRDAKKFGEYIARLRVSDVILNFKKVVSVQNLQRS